ncbi:MAG TPA: O-methyltransferase [Bacteroidia bacterium]|nr:O-methyltransferase [Bacteroidia bacterium]
MDFLPPEIENYVETYTQSESEVLKQLNRDTNANVLTPRMLSGHLQGQVLTMFSKMIRPKIILEIGTYTGYSAICLAQGLEPAGVLHTIDINEELEEMIKKYFHKAGLENTIQLHIGNAVSIIPTIAGLYDIVFIDADKENYSNYYDLVFDKVRKGGYIIADNVLWSGNVLKPENEMDEETRALVNYSKKVHADERVENVLLPVRDGLMVARKK